MSESQIKWKDFLEFNGVVYRICYDALEALEAVEDYAGIQLHGKPSRRSLQ